MMTSRGAVLRESTASSMAVSQFRYNTEQPRLEEFPLGQWLWYWPFNQVALVQILVEPYISSMRLFISFSLRTLFIRHVTQTSKFVFS